MNKVRKMLAIVLVLTMALTCFAGCGGGGETGGDADVAKTYELRLATHVNETHPLTLSAQRFADGVAEATGGNVTVTVYPSNQLGDYMQVYDELMMGTIDAAWLTIPDTYDKRNNLGATPYLATNYEEIAELYAADDSWFLTALQEVNAEQGVTVLGLVPNGFMGIGAKTVGDLDTLFDPSVEQDALMRSPGIESYLAQVEAFGFRTTTIAYADLYSALQTGVADGWYGGSAISNWQGFKDVINYFVDYRSMNEPMGMFFSSAVLEEMPQEYQDAIWEVAKAERMTAIAAVEEADAKAKADLADFGVEIIEPTEEEMAAVKATLREAVYPLFEETFGEEIMADLYAWAETH